MSLKQDGFQVLWALQAAKQNAKKKQSFTRHQHGYDMIWWGCRLLVGSWLFRRRPRIFSWLMGPGWVRSADLHWSKRFNKSTSHTPLIQIEVFLFNMDHGIMSSINVNGEWWMVSCFVCVRGELNWKAYIHILQLVDHIRFGINSCNPGGLNLWIFWHLILHRILAFFSWCFLNLFHIAIDTPGSLTIGVLKFLLGGVANKNNVTLHLVVVVLPWHEPACPMEMWKCVVFLFGSWWIVQQHGL